MTAKISVAQQGARRIVALLLALVVSILVGPAMAHAEVPVRPVTKLTGNVTIYVGMGWDSNGTCRFKHAKNGVKGLRSSNEDVLGAYTHGTETTLLAEMPGKSTVTFTYKGKRYTAKVVVKSHPNAIKSVRIGSKTYAAPFKNTDAINKKAKIFKGKRVLVTPAKGWKVARISCYYEDCNGKAKVIKNGGKLYARRACGILTILMKNTATGGYIECSYYCD